MKYLLSLVLVVLTLGCTKAGVIESAARALDNVAAVTLSVAGSGEGKAVVNPLRAMAFQGGFVAEVILYVNGVPLRRFCHGCTADASTIPMHEVGPYHAYKIEWGVGNTKFRLVPIGLDEASDLIRVELTRPSADPAALQRSVVEPQETEWFVVTAP